MKKDHLKWLPILGGGRS